MFQRFRKDDSSKLTKQQKDVLTKKFMNQTHATEKVAIATLKDTSWDMKTALLRFQPPEPHSLMASSRVAASPPVDPMKEIYQKYKDAESDMALADGISLLCDDLKIPPEDISMLVFSYHCNAAAMAEFTKEEFSRGFKSLRVTSVDNLRSELPKLRAQMEDEVTGRQIYNFAFGWAKDKGQKWLPLETAIGLWMLILGYRKWPLTEQWCEFVQEKHNKSISKDTWTQLFEFSRTPLASLNNYDEEAAWPTLIDEFVTYLQESGALNLEEVEVSG